MTAQVWMSYEDLSMEIAQTPGKRRSALDISRLRRRRQTAAGQFLSGLRSLEVLSNGHGDGKGLDLAAELAKQGLDT